MMTRKSDELPMTAPRERERERERERDGSCAAACRGYGRYELSSIAETLRASGGDIGGGSETLVICSLSEFSRGVVHG